MPLKHATFHFTILPFSSSFIYFLLPLVCSLFFTRFFPARVAFALPFLFFSFLRLTRSFVFLTFLTPFFSLSFFTVRAGEAPMRKVLAWSFRVAQ